MNFFKMIFFEKYKLQILTFVVLFSILFVTQTVLSQVFIPFGFWKPKPTLVAGQWYTMTWSLMNGRWQPGSVWSTVNSKMLVWGGSTTVYYNSGGQFDPATNTWTRITQYRAPAERQAKDLLVWSTVNNRMLVWGGYNGTATPAAGGGQYDPVTDTWYTITTTGAPAARYEHAVVWSTVNNKMIVWGGYTGATRLNTGGQYDPSADSWTATTTTSAPAARHLHSAVWSPSANRMLVWGGNSGSATNTGGRYDPSGDSWAAITTTSAPTGRYYHTAVWSTVNSRMVVWGGTNNGTTPLNTGGQYDPSGNSWSTVTTTGAPTARVGHVMVYSTSNDRVVVWGGSDLSTNYYNTGGQYNPAGNSWTSTSTTNAPGARQNATGTWCPYNDKMFVWGGYGSGVGYALDVGMYSPSGDSWSNYTFPYTPTGKFNHSIVWTGTYMIQWAGSFGATLSLGGSRYDPTTDTWAILPATGLGGPRRYHSAVWAELLGLMIVWGGYDGSTYYNTGAKYDPVLNSWTVMTTTGAPTARYNHVAVWSPINSRMIIWGGTTGAATNTGAQYDPVADSWTATTTTSAPAARYYHTGIWSHLNNKMIVWGGYSGAAYLNSGGQYDPILDSWTATTTTGAPAIRQEHTAITSGNKMYVWGGYSGTYLNTGGAYDPSGDSWTTITTTNAPTGRTRHTATYINGHVSMAVWGGYDGTNYLNSGSQYDLTLNEWVSMSSTSAPEHRGYHTAVWNGSKLIIWGGYNGNNNVVVDSGPLFDP